MSADLHQCVVVPLDFSEPSLAALEAALRYVSGPEQLHVIHVLHPLSAAEPGVIWETVSDASRCQHVREALGELLEGDRFQGIQFHVVIGDEGGEICKLARKLSADLIVISSHGKNRWERIMLGSVAERVVRLSPCDVLVHKVQVPK